MELDVGVCRCHLMDWLTVGRRSNRSQERLDFALFVLKEVLGSEPFAGPMPYKRLDTPRIVLIDTNAGPRSQNTLDIAFGPAAY